MSTNRLMSLLFPSSNPDQNNPPSPFEKYVRNLPLNFLGASYTVIPEQLALKQIEYALANPHKTRPSYYSILKKEGLKAAFSGGGSRISYCLAGNAVNLGGISMFGDDVIGLSKTSLLKSLLFPMFLYSNAKQLRLPNEKILGYITENMRSRTAQLTFLARNSAANACLWPGFRMRDYVYESTGNINYANGIGFSISLFCSAVMNAFAKPFFTGVGYSFDIRLITAATLPGLAAVGAREMFTVYCQMKNTSPKKPPIQDEDNTPQSRIRP